MYRYLIIFWTFLFLQNTQIVNAQISSEQVYKFNRVMDLISMFYVDTTAEQALVEKAIISVLKELDPHSIYISKDKVKEMNQPLTGSFEGIGITFNIFKDTLYVVRTYPGGPAEKAGLQAGDRIVSVEKELIAGTGIDSEKIKKLLLGEKGTKVKVSVKRKTYKNMLAYTITRDKIPVNSIDATYLAEKDIAYIKLGKFSATTVKEFDKAVKKLKKAGTDKIILDLRDNGGGYLRTAINITDEFLPADKLIVYTEGVSVPRSDYFSSSKGKLEKDKLIILIDEGTASASEIVTGAIQDWDRGVVIGRRSYGKGLVQRPFNLIDGSMIRLTIARYYTPTGRRIQKSYANGYDSYSKDIRNRINHGELISRDSIHFIDSLKYLTLNKKRTVYGGGGIMPDIFIAADTTSIPDFYSKLLHNGKINKFILTYIDDNRSNIMSKYPEMDVFIESFNVDYEILHELLKFAVIEELDNPESKKLIQSLKPKKTKENMSFQVFEGKEELIKQQLKALVARDIWGDEAFFKIINQKDATYLKAVEILKNRQSYNNILDN